MNYSKKDAITYLILGGILFIIAVIITVILSNTVLPELTKYFDTELNMVVMIGITAILPAFIVKALFTYACMKLRVFVIEANFDISDGFMPIFSDVKLRQLYLAMVRDYYLEDENGNPIDGISGIKRWFIANICNINVFLTILFYMDMIGFATYFYITNSLDMFTIQQVAWLISLLLIYNLNIAVRSLELGIAFKSLEDWIVTKNPIVYVIAPIIVPIISFGYLFIVFVLGWCFNMDIQQPLLNVISLFGIIVINPIISAVHAKSAIDDAKRTVDEINLKNGVPPRIW